MITVNGSHKTTKPIYVFDIETDPFSYGANIQPFACGLYDGKQFWYTWGNSCIADMKNILDDLPAGIVYAHNGGNFDMFFCMDWFKNEQEMLIINNRIVKASITRRYTAESCHEFRDSYAIMPFALKKYKKDTVDYRTFTKKYRTKNKDSIISYLRGDCVYLYELVTDFWDKFGDNLTIGSTSMKALRRLHKFENLDEKQDELIRVPYYYGGRVQCFERGIIKPTKRNKIVAYDLNQCYPHVMRNMLHPISQPSKRITNEITDSTFFVTVIGRNHNAFPVRTDEGLRFNKKHGIFSVSIHEYNAAVETGMFECEDVMECINFEQAGSFDKFVDKYHKLRKQAQESKDERGALFYKFVCNSAYGKFAQNPDNYFNYKLTDVFTHLNPYPEQQDTGWILCTYVEFAQHLMWKHRADLDFRYNVATGASITGGARSLLIRAIASAQRPLYCDTDSLICEQLGTGVNIHPTNLGAWKVEATGNVLAIGGRKMYALFSETCPQCNGTQDEWNSKCSDEDRRHAYHSNGGCVKDAHKGALLSPQEIVKVARGNTVEWNKQSPSFNLLKRTSNYLSRNITMTTADVVGEDEEYGE